jgi:hypothetical protein
MSSPDPSPDDVRALIQDLCAVSGLLASVVVQQYTGAHRWPGVGASPSTPEIAAAVGRVEDLTVQAHAILRGSASDALSPQQEP